MRGVRQDLLVHDREEVLAREPPQHERLVGADRGRVRVVDVERAHRRRHGGIRQRAAELDHIDGPRRLFRHEVDALERVEVERVRLRRGEQGPAVRIGVRAGERGQARERANRHSPVVMTREADPDPQWPELRAETPEADAIEQRQMAVPDDVDAPVRVPPDASEADVLEQSRVVPVNDEFDDDDA